MPVPQPALPEHHVRPRHGWLNDPNGMTWHGGRWHVFYQHSSTAAVHDLIEWGHVSSPDLVRWTEHPVAFSPTPGGPDRFGCWSGVFVPGLDRPAVAYSGVVDTSLASTVCLRWAEDADLDTWSAPVVAATTPETDRVSVMRDPFVFRHGGRRWALLGAGLEDGTPAVLLYDAEDVTAWRYLGLWLTHADPLVRRVAPADIWECPQLVRTDSGTAVILSLQTEGRLDRAVWLVGDLGDDEQGRPTFLPRSGDDLDVGDALYAPQVLDDRPHPLLMGWVRQDGVPADPDAPDTDLVAGCLSFPRRLAVEGDRLVSHLDPAVASLVEDAHDREIGRGGSTLIEGSARVRVAEGEGEWRLTGRDGAVGAQAAAGWEIWIDGEVVEAYPNGGGTPATWRQVGTTSWTLELDGVGARTDALVPSVAVRADRQAQA